MATIIDICKGTNFRTKKRDPRKHQEIAIEKVKKHFSKKGITRGKLIMPCGTGKSLTAYWMAQELKAKTIVVAVPSLALVKQSLEDWTTEYLAEGTTPSWLAVCSDDSVGKMRETDSSVATVYEAGIPVTTDPSKIVSFIKKRTWSPKRLYNLPVAQCWQLHVMRQSSSRSIIADEAHKTAGRKDKKSVPYCLMKICKKTTMTAMKELTTR